MDRNVEEALNICGAGMAAKRNFLKKASCTGPHEIKKGLTREPDPFEKT